MESSCAESNVIVTVPPSVAVIVNDIEIEFEFAGHPRNAKRSLDIVLAWRRAVITESGFPGAEERVSKPIPIIPWETVPSATTGEAVYYIKDNDPKRHESQTAKLGKLHVRTLSSMTRIACIHRDFGGEDLEISIPMLDDNLETLQSILGNKHPLVFVAAYEFGIALKMKGEVDAALAALIRCWEGRKAVLGEGHPDTVDVGKEVMALRRRVDIPASFSLSTSLVQAKITSEGCYQDSTPIEFNAQPVYSFSECKSYCLQQSSSNDYALLQYAMVPFGKIVGCICANSASSSAFTKGGSCVDCGMGDGHQCGIFGNMQWYAYSIRSAVVTTTSKPPPIQTTQIAPPVSQPAQDTNTAAAPPPQTNNDQPAPTSTPSDQSTSSDTTPTDSPTASNSLTQPNSLATPSNPNNINTRPSSSQEPNNINNTPTSDSSSTSSTTPVTTIAATAVGIVVLAAIVVALAWVLVISPRRKKRLEYEENIFRHGSSYSASINASANGSVFGSVARSGHKSSFGENGPNGVVRPERIALSVYGVGGGVGGGGAASALASSIGSARPDSGASRAAFGLIPEDSATSLRRGTSESGSVSVTRNSTFRQNGTDSRYPEFNGHVEPMA
ncbi:hypothetical protein HDU76_004758 [Blyttiomyces sp. JEL0837]|nr:hypothetical protein HDU76_004758 [Blyttiomyces sp. JEL0837]